LDFHPLIRFKAGQRAPAARCNTCVHLGPRRIAFIEPAYPSAVNGVGETVWHPIFKKNHSQEVGWLHFNIFAEILA
jgi:hypothetical protein